MKKVMMTKYYNKETGERGDCLRACIASLLDLEIHEFEHSTWIGDYLEKLELYGFGYMGCANSISDIGNSDGIDGLFIAYGDGSRGVNHAVIINSFGELIHDPHPSNEGILSTKNIFIIERLT